MKDVGSIFKDIQQQAWSLLKILSHSLFSFTFQFLLIFLSCQISINKVKVKLKLSLYHEGVSCVRNEDVWGSECVAPRVLNIDAR